MFVPHLPEPDAIFPATLTGMVAIRGATLAGVAAAARLSRLGHDVTLHTAGVRPGGRWTPDSHQDHAVDAMPQVITLPAAWRDVFKKSGERSTPSFARAGLRLVAAPPAVHRFADGSELELPTERGAQYHALAARYGDAVAARWRTLLDDADDVWLAARRAGVEAPHRPESREAATLWLDRTLTDLADRITHPHLARILLDLRFSAGTSSLKAPGILATRLAIERTFGRWQVVDEQDLPQPPSALLALLLSRAKTRGVRITDEPTDSADIDCLPHCPKTPWWRPSVRPADAPQVSHRIDDRPPGAGVREIVDHAGPQAIIAWERAVPDGRLVTTWDFRTPRHDLQWGIAPRRAQDVLARISVGDGPPLRASSCSLAGPEPWAELSSAALAVYELHERLTGEDCRPTNRDFTLPRLRRKSGLPQK